MKDLQGVMFKSCKIQSCLNRTGSLKQDILKTPESYEYAFMIIEIIHENLLA